MDNSIAICCIVKNENRYIREWVEHYIKIGVDGIFIYDNNDVDGERLEEVIVDYIENGKVKVIDYRGRTCCQTNAYHECYNNFSKDYGWMAFFDADEYLMLTKHENVHDYLGQTHFQDCSMIHINWMVYDDNDHVRYENKPLSERFTRAIDFDTKKSYDFPEDNHIKSIIKSGIGTIMFGTPHTILNRGIHCKNNKGDVCVSTSPFAPYNFDDAYLKHYCYKTIEEFYYKYLRGFPDSPLEQARKGITIDRFFKTNKWTQEKEDIWNNLINGKN